MSTKGQVKFIAKGKTSFFEVLRSRVDAYFEENQISKNANSSMVIKTIVLLSAYIIPFVLLLVLQPNFPVSLILWAIMGFSVAGIGMSVMHDANHGAYSENPTVNYWLGHTLNLIGGSVSNWKFQHNILHHTYTNISGMDDDIKDRLVLKFSPHTEVKPFHKFQKYYAFVFYGIMTLYWVVLKDFIQLGEFTKNGVNKGTVKENILMLIRIILDKSLYLLVIIGVPVMYFHLPLNEIIWGFVLMHFIAGLTLTVIFQLAHTVDETSHPLPNEAGTIENNWAIHQLNTTVNFSPDNKWLSWFVGGLNFQVEHHLFPKVCHVHYPNIAPIVKQTAEEYGIPYLVNYSFSDALKSHIVALEKFGKLPNLNEAIG